MTYSVLQQAAETRRSIYVLNKTLPLSNEEVTKIIEHAVLHTPSSFNSQSARVGRIVWRRTCQSVAFC